MNNENTFPWDNASDNISPKLASNDESNVSEKSELEQNIVSLDLVLVQLDGLDKTANSIKNIKSGLNKMIRAGLIHPSMFSIQFGENFKKLQRDVAYYVKDNSANPSWNSFLNDIRTAVDRVQNINIEGLSFKEALLVLCKRTWGNKSAYKFSQLINENVPSVKESTVYFWLKGAIPTRRKSISMLSNIDDFFGVRGRLLATIKAYFYEGHDKNRSTRAGKTELSSSLEKDVNNYCAWRAERIIPSINRPYLDDNKFKSSDLNPTRFLRQYSKPRDNKWSADESGRVGTIKNIHSFFINLQAFWNSKNRDGEEISFDLFFSHELLREYVSWSIERGTIRSAQNALSWIKSETKNGSYVSIYCSLTEFKMFEEWLENLELLRKEIDEWIVELSEKNVDRDGKKAVNFLLLDERPHEKIKQISTEFHKRANRHVEMSGHKMAYLRDAIAFDILLVCPLRKKNLFDLQWLGSMSRLDQSRLEDERLSGLYLCSDDNEYKIFVHKSQLKNRRSKGISNINQPINHLRGVIDNYLTQRTLWIKKYEINTSFLFFTSVGNKRGRGNRICGNGSLFKNSSNEIINYLWPDLKHDGINPHAMRHLSASLYLRDNPENFTGLATLLMDDLQTVINTYAKRDDKGNSRKISDWAAKAFAS